MSPTIHFSFNLSASVRLLYALHCQCCFTITLARYVPCSVHSQMRMLVINKENKTIRHIAHGYSQRKKFLVACMNFIHIKNLYPFSLFFVESSVVIKVTECTYEWLKSLKRSNVWFPLCMSAPILFWLNVQANISVRKHMERHTEFKWRNSSARYWPQSNLRHSKR